MIIRSLVNAILSRTMGRLRYQKHFHTLLDIAHRGMNYRSGDFRTSGEIPVITMLADRARQQKEPLVVFDIGANVGAYAAELARAFDKERTRILCFEPSKRTFAQLQQQTAAFENVSLHPLGFSRAPGTRRLFSSADNSELSSVYQRDLSAVGINLDKSEEISVVTVDDFCREHGIARIEFMKIDVEGHELDVLAGAQGMVGSGRLNWVQFEFSEADIDSRHYLRDFYDALPGYDFYRIVRDGLAPLGDYRLDLEIFKTINFLAERRPGRLPR